MNNNSRSLPLTHLFGITTLFAMLSFCLCIQPAYSGPLRERLAERGLLLQEKTDSIEKSFETGGSISLPKGIKVMRDISYGDDPLQKFDVYAPENAKDAPVIFMVHGGAWATGDKASKAVVQNKVSRWVPRGFIFISVSYRLLPDAVPFEQSEDIRFALSAAQAQAESWGGDPKKFILMGHSAGAHLVALVASSPAKAAAVGVKSWLGAILLDSATLDVVQLMEAPHPEFYDTAFGTGKTYWEAVSPFHGLSDLTPPFLAVCSTRRADSCAQAKAFVSKAASLGAIATGMEQNLSHREINERLGQPGAYTEMVEQFMGTLDKTVQRMFAKPAIKTRDKMRP